MIARNLTARVELLSDVHIGTGTNLVRDIDWIAMDDGWVYFADSGLVLEAVFQRAEDDGMDMSRVAHTLAGRTLADLQEMQWLTNDDFGSDHPLFRYRLKGAPATVNIREQIKDIYGRPYLPGSSLKGALRTVLAVGAAAELEPDMSRLGRQREWAGQPVEKQLFGKNPNEDLLRALQVGDSAALSPKQLALRRAHIYPTASQSYRGRSRGLDVDVETVVKGTVFELPIHIPTELMEDRNTPFDRRRRMEIGHWVRGADWLGQLARWGQQNAKTILEEEIVFFQERRDVPGVHRFYGDTVNLFTELKPNEFLLVIGWGGGWHTKTFNKLLKQDPVAFDRLVSRYNLNPTGKHKPGDPFPKSRHLLRVGDQPGWPLGWVKVSLEQV
ncbi:MAG: type III-A CRISPR-associated RAMP protein Csm5 [Chloroflexota bacterium]|nr:type III-A CRISPR-associated RAMP protein Csm5 [Chloroflexota bacterium]